MALPSATVWEVRPGVGSDNNGGGFVAGSSGTDFSQQNSAQYTFTDLASVSSLVVSSASHNFVAADVGNLIHITAGTGFTTGFYQIVSVAANQATLDRSPGTGGVGGTYAVGGALATIATVNANWTASNQCWVKASGSYTVTAALTFTLDSHLAPGIPASIIGYTSSRGDGGQFTWTTSTNSIDLIDFNQAANVLLQNIIFTSTAGTPGNGIFSGASGSNDAVGVLVINCKFSGFLVGIDGNFVSKWAFAGLSVVNSRVTACTSHGVRNGGATYIFGSMLDNNSGDGLNTNTQGNANDSWILENSVFYKNGANGFNIAMSNTGGTTMQAIVVKNCNFSTNTGAGIVASNTVNPLPQISNCIFDANGTYGVDTGSSTITAFVLLYNNAFFNNTTAATRGTNAGIGTVTLSASPYTTLGSNFALNSTGGGGAACKGAGFPGTIPGAGTGSTDIGALQSSGGGSTTTHVINQTVTRYVTEEA